MFQLSPKTKIKELNFIGTIFLEVYRFFLSMYPSLPMFSIIVHIIQLTCRRALQPENMQLAVMHRNSYHGQPQDSMLNSCCDIRLDKLIVLTGLQDFNPSIENSAFLRIWPRC